MDQSSPEQPKPDLFDLMPDPYEDKPKFDSWLEGLLSKMNRVPDGYGIREQKLSKAQLLDLLRSQVRRQVYEQWTQPYVHPKKPEVRKEPESVGSIRDKLKEATSDFINEERTEPF